MFFAYRDIMEAFGLKEAYMMEIKRLYEHGVI